MTFPRPDFPVEAIAAAKAHAVAEWPRESCGLIVGGVYHPCNNIAADPEKDFIIAPDDMIALGPQVQAVIHSHPDGNRAPSAADMQGQIDMGCIWGIIPCNAQESFAPVFWGDFRLEEGVIGREFLHGVSDCYSLIRAWFWQTKGVKLPDFARDDDWWKKNADIYRDGFPKAGFRRIARADVRDGDIFLGQVNSPVPNHGGVMIDAARMMGLHHMTKRLSRREPMGRWERYVTHWLRFEGLPN